MPKYKPRRYRVEFAATADSIAELVIALGNAAVAVGNGRAHTRIRSSEDASWEVRVTEASKHAQALS